MASINNLWSKHTAKIVDKIILSVEDNKYSAVQSQTAVTAYFSSDQLLLFDFARQYWQEKSTMTLLLLSFSYK